VCLRGGDFIQARIYAIDRSAGTLPKKVFSPDSRGVNHNIYHHQGNPAGGFDIDKPETFEYLKTFSSALASAERILLLRHGGGKANFSHMLELYLGKHHRDGAATIVANVRADIDGLTDAEVVRIAENSFGIAGSKKQFSANALGGIVRSHGSLPTKSLRCLVQPTLLFRRHAGAF